MAEILLIRHGQASFGTDDYDRLSDLGHRQAKLAGEFLVRTGVKLDHAYTGDLLRQKQTYAGVAAAYKEAGQELVAPIALMGYDETKNDEQVEVLLPQLLDADPKVAQYLENSSTDSKQFQKLIRAVFTYWQTIEGTQEGLESWPQFKGRVLEAFAQTLSTATSGTTSAVFTSGGVIATLVAHILRQSDIEVYPLYEPIINASITRILTNGRDVSISTFNEYSYLQVIGTIKDVTYR